MSPAPLPALLALLAAVACAVAVDWLAVRRGEGAPGFTPPAPAAGVRRALALLLLTGVFYVGVFLSFALPGTQAELDLSAVAPWELFTLHLVLGAVLLAWGVLAHAAPGPRPGWTSTRSGTGFPRGGPGDPGGPATALAGAAEEGLPDDRPATGEAPGEAAGPSPPPGPAAAGRAGEGAPEGLARRLLRAFRLAEPRPLREIGLGLVAGVAIWACVLVATAALAALLYSAGWDRWLPQGAPPLVAFIAGQPFWVRVLASLSAGFFEEVFFRGFLQPRVGIALSTLLFALAHWSYGEPFMLVGVTLLSLTYAALARWRRSVWAAVAAHAVFDGVQLLVLIPLALEAVEGGAVPLPFVGSLPLC